MGRLVTFNFLVQLEQEPDEDNSIEAAVIEGLQELDFYRDSADLCVRVYDYDENTGKVNYKSEQEVFLRDVPGVKTRD